MKKRLIGATFASVVLLAATALGVSAAPPDETGPPCANIVNGTDGYGDGTLNVQVETAAPSCQQFTYTLTVFDNEDGTGVLDTIAVSGNNTTFVPFTSNPGDDDVTVCVVVTSGVGRHIFDRAPDSGCIAITSGTGSGQRYF